MRGEDEETPLCSPGEMCEDGGCAKHASPWAVSSLYGGIVVTIRLLGELGDDRDEDDRDLYESRQEKIGNGVTGENGDKVEDGEYSRFSEHILSD